MPEYSARVGGAYLRIVDTMPEKEEALLRAIVGDAYDIIKDQLHKQKDELAAAWPKPPDKTERAFRRNPSGGFSFYEKEMRRTGLSASSFRVSMQFDGTTVKGVLTNIAEKPYKNRRVAYAYYVETKDFNYGGQGGKPVRAWHWYRRRFKSVISRDIIDMIRESIPSEL